jgi:hypothetical protein
LADSKIVPSCKPYSRKKRTVCFLNFYKRLEVKFAVLSVLVVSMASCTEKKAEYTGRLRIDAGTEYAAVEYSSSIGGACEGWKALQIRKPGSNSGLENIICWKREGDDITVTDRTGTQRTSGPVSLWTD